MNKLIRLLAFSVIIFPPMIIGVLFNVNNLFGNQTNTIDSLKKVLENLYAAPSSLGRPALEGTPLRAGVGLDTARVATLLEIASEYFNYAPDSAYLYAQQALNLSGKINYLKGIASSLDGIARYNWMTGNYQEAMENIVQKLKIYKQSGNKKGISSSISHIGLIYEELGNYPRALEFYFRALKIDEAIGKSSGKKSGIEIHLTNIGGVYFSQGDYPRALDYYLKALKIVTGDSAITAREKHKAGTILSNIGQVYSEQGTLSSEPSQKEACISKALEYYFKALKIHEEVGNKTETARHLSNIGIVYKNQGNYTKALEYYFKALKIEEEMGNKNGIARNYGNIGNIYWNQGKSQPAVKSGTGVLSTGDTVFTKALGYYFKALKAFEELGEKNNISTILGNIGTVYLYAPSLPPLPVTVGSGYKKGLELAEEYLLRSTAIADSFGFLQMAMQFNKSLSNLYDTLARLAAESRQPDKMAKYYKLAHEHYKKYSEMKDTIFNEEKTKEIGRLDARYEFDKQLAVADAGHKAELEKQAAVARAESRRQWLALWLVVAVAVAVAVIAFIIFRSLRVTQKQKRIIEMQKHIVEEQKKLVDQKNKDITDSIEYARRIQEALLTTDEYIEKWLPEYFILYLPRDIISGDFYWCYAPLPSSPQMGGGDKSSFFGGEVLLAVSDCTGHGVPGALMSMLGISFLNEIIIERNITSPEKILDNLRKEIISNLNPGKKKDIQDGMDIAICRYDFSTLTVEFAGANRPMLVVRDGKISEYSGDAMPVGAGVDSSEPFSLQKVTLQKGDVVFTFSDGFETQFGGPKNKKFMKKNLKELLLSVSHLSIKEQKERITAAFDEWKGNGEQTDDVTVMGIRII
ncbi:MAG: tetratricopeptide repeat protein [Bacteroidetes bacterium]|nr:tetratricopeptide repeat protein [Bacteroidota bacterium]